MALVPTSEIGKFSNSAESSDGRLIQNATLSFEEDTPTQYDLKIHLKTAAGNDPSPSDPITVKFQDRDDGTIDEVNITSALSTVIYDGSLLGLPSSGTEGFTIYLYLTKTGETIDLAYSSDVWHDQSIDDIIADTSGAADSAARIYGETARTDAVIIGLASVNIDRSGGVWVIPPEEVKPMHTNRFKSIDGVLKVDSGDWEILNTGSHFSRGSWGISNTSSTEFRVNFPFTVVNILNFFLVPDYEAIAGGVIGAGASIGTNFATVRVYRKPYQVVGQVSYNGSSWEVTNGSKGLAVTDFDTTTTDGLTLSHDTLNNDSDAISLTSADGAYNARVHSHSATGLTVTFYDAAGTIVGAPDTDMDFYLIRHENNTGLPELMTDAQFEAISGANLFFSGTMEY